MALTSLRGYTPSTPHGCENDFNQNAAPLNRVRRSGEWQINNRLVVNRTLCFNPRRDFLKQAGALALAASSGPLLSDEVAAASNKKTPETLVKILYDSLKEQQRSEVCFDWNHIDKNRGLLRTRLENNWKITKPSIKSSFYTADQQALIRDIFEGMTHPRLARALGQTTPG